jgi:hypothetical protein
VTRRLTDWLSAYIEYTEATEAPRHMRFWCGVSAIAGALRRKVWIDQDIFKWYPNFYIIIVAPPGVVAKSTTADVALRILRQLPGIKFGPDVVTWPALVTGFASAAETFEYPPGVHNIMSAMTLTASEFGNLFDPQDRQMVDLFVHLWDGKQGAFSKETKTSGNDKVENPWINLIACTTPAWIAGSFPEYLIGGGFTSRCIFVYADKKARELAYPKRHRPGNRQKLEEGLLADLAQIAALKGEYELTPAAYEWGEAWYTHHNRNPPPALNDDRFGGYLARKQTHIHKLAIVLAASESDSLWITEKHLAIADKMVSDLEPDMAQVFSKMGRSDASLHAERLLKYIRSAGPVDWDVAFRHVHQYFPGMRNYEDILLGLIRAKLVSMEQEGSRVMLRALIH